MCGITGIWVERADDLRAQIERMTRCLAHRGPDDEGIWMDESAGIALGFRRLSILDLSQAGHQPMLSESGRYVISYNGEVYNHLDLRRDLGEREWRGTSDTETMLAAIEAWGLRAAVNRFVGMFAIALWDRQERTLNLIRDRFGVKPLVVGKIPGGIAWASEVRALEELPGFDRTLDPTAVAELVQRFWIPAPRSIYRSGRKVKPATIEALRAPFGEPDQEVYWSAQAVAHQAPLDLTKQEANDQFLGLLRDSVRLRRIADVPLGAFLSGGIDSSLVVGMMQELADEPVKTFTIGFEDARFNEAPIAAEIAKLLHTDHHELIVTGADALALVPELANIYDEPFADSSQIPTTLVSRFARQYVTVALSGDGGDELFGGYTRYQTVENLWPKLRVIPLALRRQLERAIVLRAMRKAQTSGGRFVDPMLKMEGVLSAINPEALYDAFMTTWPEPGLVVNGIDETDGTHRMHQDFLTSMRLNDIGNYLPDDILTKVDRASMSCSLEAREPLLDHRLAEFALRLPREHLVNKQGGKAILKSALGRYLPQDLIHRPKMGFGVPMATWLRGPLRGWAEELLKTESLEQDGLLNAKPIREKWEQHQRGDLNWHNYLWPILMLQAWRKKS